MNLHSHQDTGGFPIRTQVAEASWQLQTELPASLVSRQNSGIQGTEFNRTKLNS